MNYCYRVKHKFLKVREDGSREIENYFHKAVSEEEFDSETVYYINYRLPLESDVVQGWIKICNDPKWQREIKLADNLAKYEEDGLFFDYVPDLGTYELNTEKTDMADFEVVKVGFTMNEPITKYLLFITTSNGMFYYGAKVLDKNVGDIINRLVEDDVIYKVLAPGDKARRERRRKNVSIEA